MDGGKEKMGKEHSDDWWAGKRTREKEIKWVEKCFLFI